MNVASHVGSRIRLYRKQKGMTIEQLSSQLHVGNSTISKYENGKIAIDITTLFEIANILEVNINQLVDYHGEDRAKTSQVSLENFFKRNNVFYLYQYWGRDKSVYVSAIELIPDPSSEDTDNAIMYYECNDPENYTNCTYLYNGKITYSDSFTHILFDNLYNTSDRVCITAKTPFAMQGSTTGIMTAISQSIRNPYAVKIIISSEPLPIDDNLIEKLIAYDKESINELKRSNAFVIY